MRRYAVIAGTGRYVPERVISNAELDQRFGEPVSEWLIKNVGIERRHIMAPEQATSDLATLAARDALQNAGKTPEEIDLIILATDTPDYLSPATAAAVQAKLGATRAAVYDINCACASFVTALDVAAKYIALDTDYEHVLVIGAYGMSRFLDEHHKQTATLFADGAGAVVLKAAQTPGILAAKLAANGEYHDALGIYTGGTQRPATPETVASLGKPKVEFVRKFPATFNLERWPALIKDTLAKAKLSLEDVSLFIFTQLNLRTIEATMQVMGQPMSKTHWVMDKWGYTGSACIPMALDDAHKQGRIKPGDVVVLCASGGGLSLAAAAIIWQ